MKEGGRCHKSPKISLIMGEERPMACRRQVDVSCGEYQARQWALLVTVLAFGVWSVVPSREPSRATES